MATIAVVPALLAPDYAPRVLWQDQAPPPTIGPSSLPPSCDAVVVGAGYCGLSAARALARRGLHVVVVDKEPLGWGASTRNGGMVIPELKAGPAALERSLGPVGRRLYHEVNEAFDHVEALVAGVDPAAPGGIDCDYERTGQLYLAHAPRLVRGLEELAREHAAMGEAVRFVPRDELAAEIGSDAYHGAVVMERTGGLHPARFHAGLARLALEAGAELHDRTAAVAIDRRHGGFHVLTTRGAVSARQVLVATNAYADDLLPELRRRVLPVGSYIIATDVLPTELARAVSPRDRMFVDTKNFLFYWRLTPDGRVLFGGRRSLAPVEVHEARDFLYDELVRVHPQLAGTPITHAWGGSVAITLDRLPHVGRLDGVWYATGCNGSGVALNTWLGGRLAAVLVGEAPPPAAAELVHRRIPAHAWRWGYLPFVGSWFAWQDRGPGRPGLRTPRP